MWNFVRLRNYHSWWCYWMNMNLASIGRWRQRQRKNVRNIFLATGSSIKLRTERKNVPELCVVYPIVVPEREIVRISFLYCYNNYNIRWRLDEIFFFFRNIFSPHCCVLWILAGILRLRCAKNRQLLHMFLFVSSHTLSRSLSWSSATHRKLWYFAISRQAFFGMKSLSGVRILSAKIFFSFLLCSVFSCLW